MLVSVPECPPHFCCNIRLVASILHSNLLEIYFYASVLGCAWAVAWKFGVCMCGCVWVWVGVGLLCSWSFVFDWRSNCWPLYFVSERAEIFTRWYLLSLKVRSYDQYRTYSAKTTALRRSTTGDWAKCYVLRSKTIVPLCTLLEPCEHSNACKSAIFYH